MVRQHSFFWVWDHEVLPLHGPTNFTAHRSRNFHGLIFHALLEGVLWLSFSFLLFTVWSLLYATQNISQLQVEIKTWSSKATKCGFVTVVSALRTCWWDPNMERVSLSAVSHFYTVHAPHPAPLTHKCSKPLYNVLRISCYMNGASGLNVLLHRDVGISIVMRLKIGHTAPRCNIHDPINIIYGYLT